MSIRGKVLNRLESYYGPNDVRMLTVHSHYMDEVEYLYVYPCSYEDLEQPEMDRYAYLVVRENEVIKDINNYFGVGTKL